MGSRWKILILFLLNAGMSLCISNLVFEYKFSKIKNLEVETVAANSVHAKYVSVRSMHGEAGAITLQAGGDFAGINVTDGRDKNAAVWCDKNGIWCEAKPLMDMK